MAVGTEYKLDFTDALAGLTKLAGKDAEFRAAVVQTGAAAKQSFTDAAQQALAYQQRLAGAAAEVRQAGAVYNELRAELRGAAEEAKKLEQASKAAGGNSTTAGAKLTAELEANRKKQAELKVEIELTRQAIEGERAAVAKVRQERQQQAGQQRVVTAAVRDEATAQREAAREASRSAAEARKKAVEEKKAADAADRAARAAGLLTQYEKQLVDLTEKRARATTKADIQGYTKQIKDTKSQIAELKGEAEKGGGAIGGMFSRFAGAAGAAAAIGIVVNIVKDLAAQAIDAGKKADATLGKLQFARGNDVEKAAGDMAQLAFEANRLGLDINAAGASYGSFTAAASAANLPLAEARRLYLAVAGAGAVLRISSDDVEGSLRALQQMVSKGTVSAEELRGQLGERLPGAFSIAAKSIGVTEEKLGDMLKRGEIIASDFLPKFARELEKTFGDGSAAAADALQANTNRIDNEWQRFLLRFTSATGSAVSSIAKFAKEANDFLDGITPEGRLRLGAQRAAAELKGYDRVFAAVAKQAEADAKAAGKSQQEQKQAGEQALADEEKQLRAQLALAEKRQQASVQNVGALGANTYQKDEQVNAAKQVALVKGQIQAIEDLRAARAKAAGDEDKNLQGLIEKQQLLIKQLQERQKEARNENAGDGSDYLFGKGGLNQQLVAANKELDRLMGKVDKLTKPPKGGDYLKALLVAQAKLRDEANKIELDMLKDQGQARAAEQLRQANAEINRMEANLKRLEKLAGLDGVIDGVQRDQLNALRLGKIDEYYRTLREIAQRHSDELFDLQAESDRKELDAVERKYEKLAFAARGQADLELALEEQKQREVLALQQKQEQRKIDTTANVARNLVTQTVGEVYGTGTGISVIEAKRAEKEALLKIDEKYAQDTLNNALKLSGEEGRLARTAAAAQLAVIRNAIRNVEQEKAKHKADDFLYKLVLGEQDSDENRQRVDEVAGQVLASISTILAAEQEASQAKIDAKTREIDDLQRNLDRELQYNKEGSASNIENTRQALAAAKAARREALADQQKAAKQQQLINDLQAASSIALAVANVIAGWSAIPLVGSILGAVAAAAMVASFVATKTKARSAAQSNTEGYFKGGYTGGKDKHEERGVVHGKEFVHTADVTEKYRMPLFEALHKGKPELIDWKHPTMQAILPDVELPKKLREEKQAAQELRVLHQFAPMQAEFQAMKSELAAIRQHVGSTAAKRDVVATPEGYLLVDQATGSTTHRKLE